MTVYEIMQSLPGYVQLSPHPAKYNYTEFSFEFCQDKECNFKYIIYVIANDIDFRNLLIIETYVGEISFEKFFQNCPRDFQIKLLFYSHLLLPETNIKTIS